MNLIIKSNHGAISLDKDEIKYFTIEMLEMIPGIVYVKAGKYNSKILNILDNSKLSNIKVNHIQSNSGGTECHVAISEGVKLSSISNSIKEITKYSLKKKYGLNVKYIDIYIEEME